MGIGRVVRNIAASSRAPVFPLVGAGGRDAVQDLRLDPRVEIVTTPRAATVLLVAGHILDEDIAAVKATHDQVGAPRVTVLWSPNGSSQLVKAAIPGATVAEYDLAATIAREHRRLLLGERNSASPLLPDVDPARWRGVGPYGQGGSGMTGGVPYGRPLADRASDRDGLALDQIPLRVGPFFSPLPHGIVLEVELQGDVVQSIAVQRRVFPTHRDPSNPFTNALSRPVPIAELELARARSHLGWMADALGFYGLAALAERVLRLSARLTQSDADSIERLARTLRRAGVLGYASSGVGVIEPHTIRERALGPTARASGLAEDERSDDPAYEDLGYEPMVQSDGDVRARWRQRLDESVQALRLAAVAGARRTEPRDRVESPRGCLADDDTPWARLIELLPGLIEGREWGDAMAALVSLDLDPVA